VPRAPDYAAAAAGVARLLGKMESASPAAQEFVQAFSPWAASDGFQLGGIRSITVPVVVDGDTTDATVTYDKQGVGVDVAGKIPAADATTFAGKEEVYVLHSGRQTRVRLQDLSVAVADGGAGDGLVKAPMHGRVLELFVRKGEPVAASQQLAVIEAMKMEHTLRAPFAGIVAEVAVSAGAQVVEGAPIMVIERGDAG
jgi:3-methylcrotonyl-CoA carboxylase alpha subunit